MQLAHSTRMVRATALNCSFDIDTTDPLLIVLCRTSFIPNRLPDTRYPLSAPQESGGNSHQVTTAVLVKVRTYATSTYTPSLGRRLLKAYCWHEAIKQANKCSLAYLKKKEAPPLIRFTTLGPNVRLTRYYTGMRCRNRCNKVRT